MNIDYLARAGVLGIIVSAIAQLVFGVKHPLLMWAYLPFAAMLVYWSIHNARGQTVKRALLDATLPMMAMAVAIYCMLKFLTILR